MKQIIQPLIVGMLVSFGCARIPGQDVGYEPTPMPVVRAMLELADVGPEDVVYDLGSGDGRIRSLLHMSLARGAWGLRSIPPWWRGRKRMRVRQASRTKWSSGLATCMRRTCGRLPS